MKKAGPLTGASTKGTIRSGNFDLGYSIEGAGIPTLVIGSSVFYPKTFSANLRGHLKLAFVDHRGFAPSSSGTTKGDFELEILLSDMELMRERLGLGKVIVLGHSAHGYLALEYAKKYPRHVSHVVLVATGPSHGTHMQLAERHWREAVCPERKRKFEADMELLRAEVAAHPEQRFVQFCIRMAARSWYDHDFDPSELWKGVHTQLTMFDYVYGEVFRDIDVSKGLEGLELPVFLAMGRFDYQVAPSYAWDPYRPLFRDLTLRVFDRSAHVPQMEESANFDSELLSWLETKGARTGSVSQLHA